MNNAVILHGKPTRERYEDPKETRPHEANWLPWLGKELTAKGVEVAIPALPRPYFPVYKEWKRLFEASQVGPQTGLIGHSAGAEFILRWLSENKQIEAERVVLVAPYKDYAVKYGEFSKYVLDHAMVERIGKLTIFNSLDDDEPIQTRAHELVATIDRAELIELDGFGHFRIGHNMQNEEFPQLLAELQK